MQDRRQATRSAARFAAFAAAALAVAGTSQAVPPIPSQHLSDSGSVHLEPGQPAAIQRFSVAVQAGTLNGLTFDVRVDVPERATYAVSVIGVASDAAGIVGRPPVARGSTTARFTGVCPSLPCAPTFVVVIMPLDVPAATAVDIPWHLETTAVFAPVFGTSSPPAGRVVTALEPPGGTEAVRVTVATSDDDVHLTELDRFRAWDVDLHRDALEGGAATPISFAILRTTASQTAGPSFADGDRKDRRTIDRRDPPIQGRVDAGSGTIASWAGDGPLVFVPFGRCAPAPRDRCDDPVRLELAWADGRPETEFDAGWSLDIVSLVTAGEAPRVTASATAAPAAALVSGAAEGSFETRGPTLAGQSAISAVLGPKPIVSGLLDAISFPSRGVVTARVTSIGTTPLPDDAEVIVAFTPRGQGDTVRPSVGQIGLRPGESGTFAFEPTLQCVADGPTGCALYGAMSATLGSSSPNRMPDGVVLRVDWTLELGVGLGREGSVEISVDPSSSATARP